VTSYLIVWI